MSLRRRLVWASIVLALVLALSIQSMMQVERVVTKKLTIKFKDPNKMNAFMEEFNNATTNADKITIIKRMAVEALKEKREEKLLEDGPNKYESKIVSCEQVELKNSDMMRHIDCKPLSEFSTSDKRDYLDANSDSDADWQVGRMKLYAMEMRLDHCGKLETILPSFKLDPKSPYHSLTSGPPGSYRIYPLNQQFVRQSIGKIFKANAMETTHGFVHNFVNFGFHSVMRVSTGLVCDANAFFAFNTTEADLPQSPDMFDYLVALIESGGLISLQDGECSEPNSFYPFALNLNATFIYRNEFPFVTISKHFYSSPYSSILDFKSSISQTKSDSGSAGHSDDYLTTIRTKMVSNVDLPNINFIRTVSKAQFDTILRRFVARYPHFAHLFQGGLTADDLYDITLELIDKLRSQSDEPDKSLIYHS